MNKTFYLGLIVGCGFASLLFWSFIPEISQAIYSVPPTPAFSNVTVINGIVFPNTSLNSIEAESYKDYWVIGSDKSILINITRLP